jgi:uncharacterized NAD-dependent epimerase/dehydratase family protein
LLENRRVLLLTDGHLGVFTSKTATCILRYRPRDVVGIAPAGGGLPDDWRQILAEAIEHRLDIISGLHLMIADDPHLGPLALQHDVTIHDVRRPPEGIPLGANLARTLPCKRILTVGADCAIGKMLVAVELADALVRRGRDARFIATGQTGIMISGYGIAVDRVISDFVPGAVEMMLVENKHHEALIVEGQGTLIEPAYSGVTLGLMHGCAPHGMVFCHQPSRTHLRHHPEVPILPLPEFVGLYERLMAPLFPSKVLGIALNCVDLSDAAARDAIARAEAETGLPATDVIRFGPDKLVAATEALL